MIDRRVVETKYVFLYVGTGWSDEDKKINPIKVTYDDRFDDIVFYIPSLEGDPRHPNPKFKGKEYLFGVLREKRKKGRFGKSKEVIEYQPFFQLRIGKNMLAAVLAKAKENEKR